MLTTEELQWPAFEEWRSVPGYEGLYDVSSLGRVRSRPRRVRCGFAGKGTRTMGGKLLMLCDDGLGYLQCCLGHRGEVRVSKVHRLVALAFHAHGGPERNEVNHKNADKSDNRSENLEWVSRQENIDHAKNLGLMRGPERSRLLISKIRRTEENIMNATRILPTPRYTVADDNHKYTIALPDGQTVGPLKSVTGVLEVIAKPALINWAAREASGYFKGELLRLGARALDVATLEQIARDAAMAHRRKAKDAADLGTACHDAFEAIIHGKEPAALPPELVEPVKAFKTYRLQSDVEIVATEVPVASLRHRYGGRLDFIGYSESRGGWGIGDYKTSSGFYGNEYAYQAGGGYAAAVEEQYGLDIAWAEIARFSKKPPYESEARPVTDVRAAIAGFLEALALLRRNEIPLIGVPFFTSAGVPTNGNGHGAAKKAPSKPALGF